MADCGHLSFPEKAILWCTQGTTSSSNYYFHDMTHTVMNNGYFTLVLFINGPRWSNSRCYTKHLAWLVKLVCASIDLFAQWYCLWSLYTLYRYIYIYIYIYIYGAVHWHKYSCWVSGDIDLGTVRGARAWRAWPCINKLLMFMCRFINKIGTRSWSRYWSPLDTVRPSNSTTDWNVLNKLPAIVHA